MPPIRKLAAPAALSETALEKAALHYMERYASSAQSLRRVLNRKALRAAQGREDLLAESHKHIEALVIRFLKAGILDDAAYAAMKVRSLRRRGDSARAMTQRLQAKGVGVETASQAITEADADDPQAEWKAAVRLAKRRRLGPFRATARKEHRARDLAALARAGFSFAAATKIVDAATPETLEEDQEEE